METVAVKTLSKEYQAIVGAGAFDSLEAFIGERFPHSRLFAIGDDNTFRLFAERLEVAAGRPLSWLTVEPGEPQKNLQTAERLYQALLERGATRRDIILALGGGVVGDLAGFVAATYFRGLDFIQLPTTLLAMVDSSIGGKVGVDLPKAKNAVGAFWQPAAVFADTSCLASLPDEEYLAGLAEVAKYALVFDGGMVEWLEREGACVGRREGTLLEDLVTRCVELKARIVAEDERDQGGRLLLNYGHTFAHGLEAAAGYQGINHGQAVAAGMLMAGRFSELVGLGEPGLTEAHLTLEASLGLSRIDRARVTLDDVLQAMQSDKKREGPLRLVLLKSVGNPVILADPEEEDLRRAMLDILEGGEGD